MKIVKASFAKKKKTVGIHSSWSDFFRILKTGVPPKKRDRIYQPVCPNVAGKFDDYFSSLFFIFFETTLQSVPGLVTLRVRSTETNNNASTCAPQGAWIGPNLWCHPGPWPTFVRRRGRVTKSRLDIPHFDQWQLVLKISNRCKRDPVYSHKNTFYWLTYILLRLHNPDECLQAQSGSDRSYPPDRSMTPRPYYFFLGVCWTMFYNQLI